MISARLAVWAAGLSLSDIPADVRAATTRAVLDGIGAAIAARRLGHGTPSWAVAHCLGGPAEARPLTGRTALSAPAATLASGVLVHALDFDDTHPVALVHPTSVSLPPALSVGQQYEATGGDVLVATAIGMETVCRLGAASPHGFHARGMHATAVCGALGAALVAARLMRLPAPQAAHALGIAGSSSAGLLEFLGGAADTKALHPGSAGMNGVLAARLAAAGATGPAAVVEGKRGLYAALSARDADAGSVVRGLGEEWTLTQTVVKPYPSCQLMHVALDAVAAAVAEAGGAVDPRDVVEVEVEVHPDSVAIVCESEPGQVPPSEYAAKFDLPWSVAALLTDGEISVDTYSAASIRRPHVAELAASVRTTPGDGAGSAADAAGRAVLRLRGDRQVSATVPGSKGTRVNPVTDQDVYAKFVRNCGNHPATAELGERIVDLPAQQSLGAIMELAAAHCPPGDL